jgi:putative Holliday junction resolvase
MATQKTILAIDYGQSKIGWALSQDGLVELGEVWQNRDSFFKRIIRLCEEREVVKIVVGLPEGQLAKEVRIFAQRLKKETGLPVVFYPEVLTTQEAIDKMVAVGKGRQFRRKREDAFAAGIILQRFLEEECLKT